MKPGILMSASCVVLELLTEELTSVSEMQILFHRGMSPCHPLQGLDIFRFSQEKKTTRDETKKNPLQRTKRVGYLTSHQEEVPELMR